MNTDPSAVAYDAVKKGIEIGADVIIINTAGRLHTKVNLMNELGKIKRVMQKVLPDAPHEVMLVLDGSTGQNAVIQAREFTKATEVTSLAVTKLDVYKRQGVLVEQCRNVRRNGFLGRSRIGFLCWCFWLFRYLSDGFSGRFGFSFGQSGTGTLLRIGVFGY